MTMHENNSKLLDTVSQMLQLLLNSSNIDESLLDILRTIVEDIDAQAGSIFLLNDDHTKLNCKACIGPVDITGLTIDSTQGLVGEAVTNQRSKLTDSSDPSFTGHVDKKTGFTTRSIAVAPISINGDHLGVVQLINARGINSFFQPEVLPVLESMASAAALALENYRLTESQVKQAKLTSQIELARSVQETLLLQEPSLDGSVVGKNIPARGISGDFFSIMESTTGRIDFCIADVSGKGVHAGMLMARIATLWRMIVKRPIAPSTLLKILNEEVLETSHRGMFCTFICGYKEGSQLTLAMAGHEPALHLKDHSIYEHRSIAPPLGVAPWESAPEEVNIDLKEGPVYLFTDGITDGVTANGSTLGFDGFLSTINAVNGLAIEGQVEAITRQVTTDPDSIKDDVTLLIFDRINE